MNQGIQHVTLQSMSDTLGHDLATRYCAPLAFYMLLRAVGYLDQNLMPDKFCQLLDRQDLTTKAMDWSRPDLSRLLRQRYGASIVSWQLAGGDNIEAMKRVGYLDTEREVEFFREHVYGRSVEQIVRDGYPVVVTMGGGFNHGGSNIHAVVIASWSDDEVLIFDPDARNNHQTFKPSYVVEHLSATGGGSVVLPPA